MGMLFFICHTVCIRYKFYKLIFVSCFIFFWLSSFNKSIAELLTNSLSAREIIWSFSIHFTSLRNTTPYGVNNLLLSCPKAELRFKHTIALFWFMSLCSVFVGLCNRSTQAIGSLLPEIWLLYWISPKFLYMKQSLPSQFHYIWATRKRKSTCVCDGRWLWSIRSL